VAVRASREACAASTAFCAQSATVPHAAVEVVGLDWDIGGAGGLGDCLQEDRKVKQEQITTSDSGIRPENLFGSISVSLSGQRISGSERSF
jgi:hypothetical protein